MSEAALISSRRIVAFSAIVETATGVALMIAPAVVSALLVRAEISGLALLLGRCMGVSLVALGLACWPEQQRAQPGPAALRAVFTYNALIALLLGYVGTVLQLGGPLLWPAVTLHGAVVLLLAWARLRTPLGT